MISLIIFIVSAILTMKYKESFISLIAGTTMCLSFLYLLIVRMNVKDILTNALLMFRVDYKAHVKPVETQLIETQNATPCSIEDMYQFIDIPFEWHWVINLNHANGIAWFQLNKNNQYVALQYIDYINNMIIDAKSYIKKINNFEMCTEEIDFDYPIPMYLDSMTNTRVECTPYTKTGKISKYPVTLCFASSKLVTLNNGYKYQEHPYRGLIKIMQDGNIGSANIVFAENRTSFSIGLNGLNLIIKRIDSDNGVIYKWNDN
jgi:hypothetical protein